ncbi:hypothetical protein [Stenotrophomonas maltophilia]|uniref:hypothetical protein n=1 Tax=Stenotrophomonas maltophilia TaxID=40324 RepID=UPI003CE4DB7B
MHPLNDTWSLFEGMYSMPLLNWSDRDEDLTRSALTPYRLLEPVASLSYGEVDSPNMLIEGDNLDALKALLPYYAGQVKCIFIDPPYNTRSALGSPPFSRTLTRRPIKAMRSVHVEAKEVQHRVQARCG